jgi:meso-butanediol dehydrogenase/(S,S)-butanediol dehydrogenase/diacetyl reductase
VVGVRKRGMAMERGLCRRFEGKVALVTGAASGIGAATAQRLASEGARVVLTDRDRDGVEGTCATLAEPHKHLTLTQDVTIDEQWRSTLQSIRARYQRLDVLVNNAGWSRMHPITECSLEEWREILAVNLDSVFMGTKHAIPLLATSGSGAIVNISSIRSYVASSGSAAYASAKSGIRMLTKVAAIECAETGNGVRVNSVHPGFVNSNFSKGMASAAALEQFQASVPLRRFAEPYEIAAAIAFLASDDASYITGSELVVDGAFTAR